MDTLKGINQFFVFLAFQGQFFVEFMNEIQSEIFKIKKNKNTSSCIGNFIPAIIASIKTQDTGLITQKLE